MIQCDIQKCHVDTTRRQWRIGQMNAKEMREINKKNIIEGTINCFREVGIVDTTSSMIAEKSGVSLRTVTRCFPVKDELIVEATIQYLSVVMESMKEFIDDLQYTSLSGIGQVEFILEKRGEILFSDPRYYMIITEIELMIAEHHVGKVISDKYYKTLLFVGDIVEKALEKGVSDKSIRENVDISKAKNLLTGIYKGLLQRLTIQCIHPEAGNFIPKEEINNFYDITIDYLTHL